jgi:hypothetical protein
MTGAAEDGKQRVARPIDLDYVVSRDRRPNHPGVGLEQLAVSLPPERLQQRRRALGVREQER